MTYAKKGPAARADRLFSRLVRTRGQCQRCGDTEGPFECAHVIRRRYMATRCVEDNAWCLCRPCHRLVDSHQVEFVGLVAQTIGDDRYRELYRTAQAGTTKTNLMFWRGEVERLLARCQELDIDTRWRIPT